MSIFKNIKRAIKVMIRKPKRSSSAQSSFNLAQKNFSTPIDYVNPIATRSGSGVKVVAADPGADPGSVSVKSGLVAVGRYKRTRFTSSGRSGGSNG